MSLDTETPEFDDTPEFVPTLADDDTEVVDDIPEELPPCRALMGFVAIRRPDPVLTFKPVEAPRDDYSVGWTGDELHDQILDTLADHPARTVPELSDLVGSTSVPKAVRRMVAAGELAYYRRYLVIALEPSSMAAAVAREDEHRTVVDRVLSFLRRQPNGIARCSAVLAAMPTDIRESAVRRAFHELRKRKVLERSFRHGVLRLVTP